MQFFAVIFLCTVHLLQYSEGAAVINPVSGWVNHLRIGDVLFAKSPDKQQMSDYFQETSHHYDGITCFKSAASTIAEDGPLLEFSEQSREKRDYFEYDDYETQDYTCLREVDRVFYYPEFAIGRLENGCTAFLVGPYHALTTAKCVYDFNNRLWEKKLDFLRAQNGTEYLQRMEWEELYIPREFFEQNSDDFDWALILFNRSHPSPVWHPFMYCPGKCPEHYSTAYGYKNWNMILKECEVFEEECHKRVEMQCCQNDVANFHGGPIFGGYGFDGSKILPVVGISTYSNEETAAELESKSNEIAKEEIIFDSALKIDSEIFWMVCMLMENSGFDSDCKKL